MKNQQALNDKRGKHCCVCLCVFPFRFFMQNKEITDGARRWDEVTPVCCIGAKFLPLPLFHSAHNFAGCFVLTTQLLMAYMLPFFVSSMHYFKREGKSIS